MSLEAMARVFAESNSALGARLVLLALADYAQDHDHAPLSYPSVATLARAAHLSERAVRHALRRLEADGEIHYVGDSYRGTRSYVSRYWQGAEKFSPPEKSTPEPSIPSEKSMENGNLLTTVEGDTTTGLDLVFIGWRAIMDKGPQTKFTPDRRRKVASRLAEGYTVERILRACRGCAGSDFHMKRGKYADRDGPVHDDLTLICRAGSMIEKFESMPEGSASGADVERRIYDGVPQMRVGDGPWQTDYDRATRMREEART